MWFRCYSNWDALVTEQIVKYKSEMTNNWIGMDMGKIIIIAQ